MAERAVVGPVPAGCNPEEYDRLRRRILWSMRTGLYVVGSGGDPVGDTGGVDGEPLAGEPAPGINLMTCNWCLQVATDPKLVAVGIETGAVTTALIRSRQAFSVSILRRQDRALVRRFVKPVREVERDAHGQVTAMAGHRVDQTGGGAPVLHAALAWLDCAVRHQVELGSHVLFVGEVVRAGLGGGSEGLGEWGPDDVEVLRMEDTRMSYGG